MTTSSACRGRAVIRRAVLLAVAATALSGAPARAAGCGGTATPARVGRPVPWRAWRAELNAPAPVYGTPGARRTGSVSPEDWAALLVLGAHERRGRCWVRVRLPARPNSAAGWLDANRVQLTGTTWRLAVHTRSRRLDGKLGGLGRWRVAPEVRILRVEGVAED